MVRASRRWLRLNISSVSGVRSQARTSAACSSPSRRIVSSCVGASSPKRATAASQIAWVLAEMKPGRRLQTNVEFYTALILHSLGLEARAFTPTFAVARVAGWTAHILEQIDEDRLIRPRVVYTGPLDQGWVPAELRGGMAGSA